MINNYCKLLLPPTPKILHQIGPPGYQPYMHTADLLALASHINASPPIWPPKLHAITIPLNVDAWRACVKLHPDPAYANYIISGSSRVGFAYNKHSCTPATSNHPSANEHPSVIAEILDIEVTKSCLVGPLDPRAAVLCRMLW